jgi:hypothetical protein
MDHVPAYLMATGAVFGLAKLVRLAIVRLIRSIIVRKTLASQLKINAMLVGRGCVSRTREGICVDAQMDSRSRELSRHRDCFG